MSTLNLVRIGNMLRKQRVLRGLSIRDLSAKSGVSSGAISQIETGKTAPNLVSVHTLCQVLDFPIAALFDTSEDELVSLVRKNERNSFIRNISNGESIREELIIKGSRDMWGGIIKMIPGTNSGDFYTHEGEEFIYIIKGSLLFELEGYPPYTLEEGDTIYYPNNIGHKWENSSNEICEFIITSTSVFNSVTDEV